MLVEPNNLYNADCLDVMPFMSGGSVDLILCDLPYGKTAMDWDFPIPFDPLFKEYRRILKSDGLIILTATQPFTSILVMSNLQMFKQELIWYKAKGSDPYLAKRRIMSAHESILIFGQGKTTYNPQMRKGDPYKAPRTGGNRTNQITGAKGDSPGFVQQDNPGFRYPLSVLEFPIHCGSKLHPSQKPLALFEYLIRTYSRENELVFDSCIGSGTTAIAAINSNRRWIGIEKDSEYYSIATERIEKHKNLIPF
jgi:site-specific DNA-methyltransferase (adenine-specific)